MVDLEKHAFKRDNRFLVRLILGVLIAGMLGVFIFAKMTDPAVAACAADAFGGATEDSKPAPPAR